MKILVACEYSGIVRDAFLKRGHEAMSCDLLETEQPGPHYKGDVRHMMLGEWDLMIAHPPCTYLAVSGARWWGEAGKQKRQCEAIGFVRFLMESKIQKIALENPVGKISTAIRKPDQIIHPWQFGHGETKSTCLWLKNLPLLKPTKIVDGRENRIHRMAPSPNRWKDRSRTYTGIAEAMAQQWG